LQKGSFWFFSSTYCLRSYSSDRSKDVPLDLILSVSIIAFLAPLVLLVLLVLGKERAA
jgi:hypothetical protein